MRLSNMESGQIVIRRHGADRIRRGHLWVYRSDIVNPEDAEPGSIVSVRDERETILGKAFFSSKSQISLRFLSRGDAQKTKRDLDRKSTRLNSSHVSISYAVFCLKKKKQI